MRFAMSLPRISRDKIFDALKKEGILMKNRELLVDDSIINKQLHLKKERKHAKSAVAMCSSCKGFYSAKNISSHKTNCPGDQGSQSLPMTIATSSLISHITETSVEVQKFNNIILSGFRNDHIGNHCRTDKFIKIFGLSNFHKVLARTEKKDSLREKLMGDMRRLAALLLLCKKKAKPQGKTISSCDDMLNISNIEFVQEALLEMTKKEDGSLKSGLCCNLGFLLKKVCSVLKAHFLWKDDTAKAMQFDKFHSVLNLFWHRWFSEAQYDVQKARQLRLRKPKRLPNNEAISELRNYNVTSIKQIVSDQYNFISHNDYVTLRDHLVCRLTLFNARRGGEPSRLLLDEWKDAENDEWIGNVNSISINDPSERRAFDSVKIAYQAGKNLNQMVPLLIPNDCLPGLRQIANPGVRQDASVDKHNPFLFANTKKSCSHVKGWNAVKSVSVQAGIRQNITATSIRHRASTIYASLDVPESERQTFYQHMGHSQEINKNVYQAPLAVQEVTKVGKFLRELDCMTGW